MALLCPYSQAMETCQLVVTKELVGDQYKQHKDNIFQLAVANQRDMAGSETDCGYHSLCNGLAIAQFIQSATPAQQAHFLSWLSSEEEKGQLFVTPDSPWKSMVIEDRMKKEARKRITKHLLKSIKNSEVAYQEPEASPTRTVLKVATKEWILIKSQSEDEASKVACVVDLVRNISVQIADKLHPNGQNNSFLIRSTEIVSSLDELLKMKSKPDEEMVKRIATDKNTQKKLQFYQTIRAETLAKYLEIKDIEITLEPDSGTWIDAKEINDLSTSKATFRKFFEADEKQEQGDSSLPVITIGDSPEAKISMAQDAAVRIEGEFSELTKKLTQDSNHLALILVYEPLSNSSSTVSSASGDDSGSFFLDWFIPSFLRSSQPMKQQQLSDQSHQSDADYYNSASKEKGHWFTLVVNKVGKELQFLVTDSWKNTDRLNDRRITEIIKLLKGEMVPVPIADLPPLATIAGQAPQTSETIRDTAVNQSLEINKAKSDSQSNTWIENDWLTLRNTVLAIIAVALIIICIRNFQSQKKDTKKNPPTTPDNPPPLAATATEPKKT